MVCLKDGDRNTKFFHLKVDQRRKTKQIKRLKDENGNWMRGRDNCERMLISNFKEIFTSSNPANTTEVFRFIRGKLFDRDKQLCSS